MAQQDVLAFDLHLRGVEDLGGGDLVVVKFVNVRLDELAMDIAGDGANQVGNEEETVFQNADASTTRP